MLVNYIMRSGLLAQFYLSFSAKLALMAPIALFAANLQAEGLKQTIFQSVSWQLPNEPFISVAVHPLQSETAVVGGETGTEDGGRSWQRVLFLENRNERRLSFFSKPVRVSP